MNFPSLVYAILAMPLGAVALYLLLPRGNRSGRLLGGLFGVACLVCLALLGQSLGGWTDNFVYGVTATTAVVAAAMTVTFRSPVYCAIWFALSLLATGGLFLILGAQFLGVATIVVYAGAILVTFLFVLMLAQPGGHAFYDRVSWEGPLAAVTGAILVGLLSVTVGGVLSPGRAPELVAVLAADQPAGKAWSELGVGEIYQARLQDRFDQGVEVSIHLDGGPTAAVKRVDPAKLAAFEQAVKTALKLPEKQPLSAVIHAQPLPGADAAARQADVLHPEHVAKLGGRMFSKHLIAVEIAGTLLLVALVGAVAILGQDKFNKRLPTPQDVVPVSSEVPA